MSVAAFHDPEIRQMILGGMLAFSGATHALVVLYDHTPNGGLSSFAGGDENPAAAVIRRRMEHGRPAPACLQSPERPAGNGNRRHHGSGASGP